MIMMPILKIETTIKEQINKCLEEVSEVMGSVLDEESEERQLEECIDVIQASLTLLYMIAPAVRVEVALAKHFIKMKNRGYDTKGFWEVTY